MASNFDFLDDAHSELRDSAVEAESLVHRAPRAACFTARFALEQAVHWLYANDPNLSLPYDHKLGALIHERSFKDNLGQQLFNKVRTVLKVGNHAAHNRSPLRSGNAVHAVRELFHVLYWLSRTYALDPSRQPRVQWDENLLPAVESADKESVEEIAALEKKLADSDAMAKIAEERRARTESELAELKKQVAALKKKNDASPDDHDYDEETTRDRFIDILLVEAGWDPHAHNTPEYEVFGMPKGKRSPNGRGLVDYVLWGDNGLPLALVEAKRTRKSARKGQHQAELYANCLEQKFGRRPVIFCSNGDKHWLWDDQRYPIREVAGFYTKAELELIHHRRANAKKLSLVAIDNAIVDRPYQHQGIRQITETFTAAGRKNLLVMATGTGKTRTVIALVDLMKRADWVKRVLFLADRNALLIQAKRAFQTHLPTATVADITQDKSAVDANVILSTYPTMMNRVERPEGRAVFGPGHFDLVVVDEAHRSVYKKYSHLFEYFDALLVGLTATPRKEVHRDTYRIFDLEPGVPTYAYELDRAVGDGHLVPPMGISVPFKFLRVGIKYSELSEEDKEEYEDKLLDDETGELPDHVDAAALNKWLFNIPTVDTGLEFLMQHGLKVEDGDRLGKTIVFARNQKHAEFIEERFNINYPEHKGTFARVIHSQVDYVQDLIDKFSEADKQPSIALSVDMLDTGIDVPEVLNLVFFKPVRSRVKFNQMIGRGTRLCKDLLGPGQDKTEFLVFDYCGNFEFFDQDLPDKDPKPPETLTSRLFRAQMGIVMALEQGGATHGAQEVSGEQSTGTLDEESSELRTQLLDNLHAHVAELHLDNFFVRKHRKTVEEFADRARWAQLTPTDVEVVSDKLAALPNVTYLDDSLEAKQFDLLCYRVMLAQLSQSRSFERFRDKVRDLADKLEEKSAIPMVKAKIDLIQEVQDEEFWADITPAMIDRVRRQLRDLIQFIDRRTRPPVYTDLPDPLMGAADIVQVPTAQTGFSQSQYRKKVEAIIRANEDHITVAKLRRNQPLTQQDLEALEEMLFDPDQVGSREQFEQAYGADVSLPLFIRKLVGLDRTAAKEAFSGYLVGKSPSASQISFINTLIDYLTQNGVMDPAMLYEPPFTDVHYEGLDGVFNDDEADNIVAIVRGFNAPVGAFEAVAG